MYIVGKVIKPHGIKGDIKVQSLMDTPDEFSKLDQILIGNKGYTVKNARTAQKFVILSLLDIDTISDAEELREKEIFITKSLAPPLAKGRYYIADLIGSKVYSNEDYVGELTDILQYGSADIYCINGDRKFMFPYIGQVITSIDTENKKIVLNSDELTKVAVYED